jgi:hypothetical protein
MAAFFRLSRDAFGERSAPQIKRPIVSKGIDVSHFPSGLARLLLSFGVPVHPNPDRLGLRIDDRFSIIDL